MKNSLPLKASWWTEFRTLFRLSKCIIFKQPPYTNFLRYYGNYLPLEASWWAEFRPLSIMSKFIIFRHSSCINFLQYNEKSDTAGSVVMSTTQNTFQNVEVYYFYAAAMYLSSKILWNILYRSKRHYEQNSDHFSEGRSVLLLCSRHLLIL